MSHEVSVVLIIAVFHLKARFLLPMRKIRIASKGKGKSGGYRVITFFSGQNIPVFLVTIYAKNQKENITDQEKNEMRTLSAALIKAHRRKK